MGSRLGSTKALTREASYTADSQHVTLLQDLRDSEKSYIRKLRIMEDHFRKPLSNFVGTPDEVLTMPQIDTLFKQVEPLVPLNTTSVDEPLDERLGDLNSKNAGSKFIGDIFGKLRPNFFDEYSAYANHYAKAREQLLFLNKYHQRWQKWCQDCYLDGSTGGAYVQDLLMLPIQRICQYPRFLRELIPHTTSNPAEEAALQEAVAHLERNSKDVTRLLEYDLGESGRIDKVHRSLIPMQDRFPQEPYRKLVKEGYLYYEDPENMLKKVYVHLFNDSLLLSFPMKWKFLTKHVFYHSATSYDAPFGGNDWDIKSPSRSIVVQGLMGDESVTLKLFGADRLERDDWYDEIDQTRKMWSETGNRLELDAVATANKLVPDAQRVGTRWKPPTKRAQIATVKNTPSKQGVLLCKLTSTSKGTKLKQNWKRRFVVVKDGVLRVYNGENAQGQPISTVQLHRAVISIPDRSDLKGDETKYAFAVSSANEKDLFAPQPNGKRALEEWVHVVRGETAPPVDVKAMEETELFVDMQYDRLKEELRALGDMGASELQSKEAQMRAAPSMPREGTEFLETHKKVRSSQDRRIRKLIEEVEEIQRVQRESKEDIQKLVDELVVKDKQVQQLTRGSVVASQQARSAELEERNNHKDRDIKLLKARHEEELRRYKRKDLAWNQVEEDAEASDAYLDPFDGWNKEVWPNYGRRTDAALEHDTAESLPPMVDEIDDSRYVEDIQRLEQEKEVLKHQLESYKADNEAIVASMSSGGASGDVPPSEYGHFYRNKAELESWLRERKAFYNVATQGDHKTADLDRLRAEFDNYKNTDRQRRRVMHREMEDLASDMRSRRCREPCDTEDLDRAWADLETAERMYMDALHDEEIRRNIQGHHKAEFRDEAARLVDWCRMQKANLMVLEDPDQIQEFCASLQNTFVQMESNLEVLTEMGESLLPDKDVEQGLLEVCEVWLNLQVFAYEMVRNTLLEVHADSKVEEEIRTYAPYSKKVKFFLDDVEKLLNLPTDDESLEVVSPILRECRQLQGEYGVHALLMDHLADFSLRMECLSDNFNVLKRSVLAKLTFMTRHFGILNSTYSRQRDFDSSLSQLSDWVGTSSKRSGVPSLTFGGWDPMQKQVDGLKAIIEDELRRDDYRAT